MTLQRDMKDMIEPIDKHEPIDNSDPAHAIEPTERTEPTDATDSTDPFEAIDNTESSDHRDHLELSPARRIHGMLRPRTMRGSPRGLAAVPVESGVCHRRESKYAPDFAPPASSRVGLPPSDSSSTLAWTTRAGGRFVKLTSASSPDQPSGRLPLRREADTKRQPPSAGRRPAWWPDLRDRGSLRPRLRLGLTAGEQRGVVDVDRCSVAGHCPRPLLDH